MEQSSTLHFRNRRGCRNRIALGRAQARTAGLTPKYIQCDEIPALSLSRQGRGTPSSKVGLLLFPFARNRSMNVVSNRPAREVWIG